MEKQKAAVIFDFDGTVANTVFAIAEAVNRMLRDLGLPERSTDEVLLFVGRGARELVRRAIGEPCDGNQERIREALAIYEAHYRETYRMTAHAYRGMKELISRLSDEGFAVAILSNKQDEFVKNLCRQVLEPGSFRIAKGVAPGDPTKPDPILSDFVAQTLETPPERCIMVGDSDIDLLTAQKASMYHIGVTWGFRSKEFLKAAGAEHLADDPDALYAMIRERNESLT